jgi:hypothetical protein
MAALGSSITNLAASGLPDQLEDRAYAFCLGTQIFQNPAAEPRNGSFSFKVSPNVLDAPISGNTGSTAIGLATAANISTVSTWSSAAEISDNGGTYGVYAVSFGETVGNGGLVSVFAAGTSLGTVAKNRVASGVNITTDVFACTSHGYNTGDAVVIYSGSTPTPLQQNVTYYVISSGANAIALADTRANAIAGSGIDITVSGGPIYLQSDDLFTLSRNGLTGAVSLSRNGQTILTYGATSTATLRPFFWTRESSNSATIPVFKEIKVSGAS